MLQEIVCGFFIAIGLIVLCSFVICIIGAAITLAFFKTKDKYYKFSKSGKI